jgi:hypothetical protein
MIVCAPTELLTFDGLLLHFYVLCEYFLTFRIVSAILVFHTSICKFCGVESTPFFRRFVFIILMICRYFTVVTVSNSGKVQRRTF